MKGEMRTERVGTAQDSITPGPLHPLPQPGSISHHWKQPGDPRASQLHPSQAGEDLCSGTFHPQAQLGSTKTKKTWVGRRLDNCSLVSTPDSAQGLRHRPSCTAPSLLPAEATCRGKAILHVRASRMGTLSTRTSPYPLPSTHRTI